MLKAGSDSKIPVYKQALGSACDCVTLTTISLAVIAVTDKRVLIDAQTL